MEFNFKIFDLSQKSILFIGLFSVLFIFFIRWNGFSGSNYLQIIKSDGIGYFYYFPQTFDSNFEIDSNQLEVFLHLLPNNSTLNKYPIGTALMQSPFVTSAWLIDALQAKPLNWFGESFQKLISIAGLFYAILGLWFMRKLLKLYEIEERIISFSLFAFFFGTNLSYYSLVEPSMSHVYSFSMISVGLWLIKKWRSVPNVKFVFWMAVVFGLIILIRPVNVLFIFLVPLLTLNEKTDFNFKQNFVRNTKSITLASLLLIGVISIQLIFWKWKHGSFFLWSYADEGFYFDKPQLIDYLMSFRKGLFIYTPLSLLAVIVFLWAYRKNIKYIFLFALAFVPLVYLHSAWWNWYYGDSYGNRVMIDFMAFFILLFALGMKNISLNWQRILVIFSTILILLNLFQTYQYYEGIMSHFDMNREKYWAIFGKAGADNIGKLGGNDDIVRYHTEDMILLRAQTVDFGKPQAAWLGVGHVDTLDQQEVVCRINSEFGLSLRFPGGEVMDFASTYLVLSNHVKLLHGNDQQIYWTISYFDSNFQIYQYQSFKINELPLLVSESRTNTYRINLQRPKNPNDLIQLAIWNQSKADFEISKLHFQWYSINKILRD